MPVPVPVPMPAPMPIRPAQPSDVDAMVAIEIEAGRRFRSVGLDSIADDDPGSIDELLLYVEQDRAWMAVDDAGQPVGYAVASVVDGEGHLDQVSVVPDAGGAGWGRALVEAVSAWAAANGFAGVTLTTFADVPFNGPWYTRLGFEVVAEQDWGPEVRALRAQERADGIDVAPRVVMRRAIGPGR